MLPQRGRALPGGFCAYIRHVPAGVGFGRVADAALADLARDLRSEAEESPSVDQLTTEGQVVMAARALETERLAAFLRDHAAEAMLVTEA